jgi:hypothetical protein
MRAPSFTPTLAKSLKGYDCTPPPIPADVDPELLLPDEVPGGLNDICIESRMAVNRHIVNKSNTLARRYYSHGSALPYEATFWLIVSLQRCNALCMLLFNASPSSFSPGRS